MNIDFVQGSLPLGASIWWLALWAKSVGLLLLILGVSRIARRASASTRHAIWLSGFIALALLAVASWFGGKTARVEFQTIREVVVAAPPSSGTTATSVELKIDAPAEEKQPNSNIAQKSPVPTPPPLPDKSNPSAPWVAILWLLVATLLVVRLAVSHAIARRNLLRDVYPVDIPMLAEFTASQGLWRPVTFFEHAGTATPLTFGTLSPKIVLPSHFRSWESPRQIATLVHEFAHIRRCDTLTLDVARIISCLFWTNPFIRRGLREMRHLQEEAADNAVILHGGEHEGYAEFLVEIARASHPGDRLLSGGIAMATPKLLPERITAILDRSRNRDRTSRNAIFHLYGIATLASLLGLIWVGEVIEVRAESAPTAPTSTLTSDDRELLQKILDAHPKFQKNLPSVHFLGSEERWGDRDGVWTHYPVPTKFEVWLRGDRKRPNFRIDLFPEVTPWEQGAAPWYIENLTEFSDGSVTGSVRFSRDYADYDTPINLESAPLDFYWWRASDDFPERARRLAGGKNQVNIEKTTLDGAPVVRVRLIEKNPIRDEIRWFDPAKNFALVKMKETLRMRADHSESRGVSFSSFSQIESGEWFPTEGEYRLDDLRGQQRVPQFLSRFKLTSMESADSLPDTFFSEGSVLAALSQKSRPKSNPTVQSELIPVGGVVVNSEGNKIVGAKIRFKKGDWEKDATTDQNGKFSTELPSLDKVRVFVTHPAFASLNHFQDFRMRASQPYSALADQTAVIVMERGVGITGIVMDAAGSPIEGAEIVAVRDRWGWELPEVRSDGEGRFRVPRGLYQGPIYLTAQHPEFGPGLKILPPADAEDDLEAQFVLPLGKTVRARILSPGGEPVPDALVVPDQWRKHTRTIDHSMRTDSEGFFEWNTAPADQVLYDILTNEVTLRALALAPSEEVQEIVLKPALTLKGTVTGNGKPVENFTVTMGRKTDPADSDIHWETYNQRTFTNGKFEWACDSLRLIYFFRIEAEGLTRFESQAFLPSQQTATLKARL